MRRYNRSTIMTSNRPLEEWGKLLDDVPTAGAILDRFLHHAQTIAITGPSYRLKDRAAVAAKEDKNKKRRAVPLESSARQARELRLTARPWLVLTRCEAFLRAELAGRNLDSTLGEDCDSLPVDSSSLYLAYNRGLCRPETRRRLNRNSQSTID